MKSYFFTLVIFISLNASAGGEHKHDHHHQKSPAGEPASSGPFDQTIKVNLLDSMRFEFEAAPEIKAGQTVKFMIKNKGKIAHEFSIGSSSEHEKHREMMRQNPDMKHLDGNTVTVEVGETKTLIWKFGNHFPLMFACNIPGHFEAGMKHVLEIQKH